MASRIDIIPTAAGIASRQPGGFRPELGSDGITRYRIQCPAHEGDSLNCALWDYRDKKNRPQIGARCHSRGCDPREIRIALGVAPANSSSRKSNSFVCEYEHPDGKPRPVHRLDYPKDFDPEKPCGYQSCGKTSPHKHVWGKGSAKDCHVYLWGLDSDSHVCVIVEGEKPAQALEAMGASARGYTPVSWRGGAGAARDADYSRLAGRQVIVWPDKDGVGLEAMRVAAGMALAAGAVSTAWIEPPESLPEGGDAADMSAEDALAALETAAAFEPPPPPARRPRPAPGGGGDDGDGYIPTTRVLRRDVDDLDRLIHAAAHKLAGGDYLRLFELWYQRVESRWLEDSDENIETTLSRGLVQSAGYMLSRAHKAEALDMLKTMIAPNANFPSYLDPAHRLLSFNLDSGDLLEGAVFGGERVWLEKGKTIERASTDDRDFMRSVRSYALPTEAADTPMWDGYLEKTFETPEDGTALMESIGITLAGYTGYQVAVALRGPGRTGKGVCFDFLIQLLGGSSHVATYPSPTTIAKNFATYDLIGKSAALLPDMPPRPRGGGARSEWDEGLTILKHIVGEDAIRAEGKYKPAFSSKLQLTVWMATNHALSFAAGASDASAWGERLRIHPFESVVPREERVPDFGQALFDAEGPAVALKCLLAAAEAGERGGLTVTEAMRGETRDAMRDVMGDIAQFVDSKLRFGEMEAVSRARVRDALSEHIKRAAHNGDVAALNSLLDNRAEQFIRQGKVGGERGWRGVGLASDPPPPDPEPAQGGLSADVAPCPICAREGEPLDEFGQCADRDACESARANGG